MTSDKFISIGEYAAAGLYEESERSLFYRKALGLRRFFEHCELAEYNGEHLYPSGVIKQKMKVVPTYLDGLWFKSGRLAAEAPMLSKLLCDEFCKYHSTVPGEHPEKHGNLVVRVGGYSEYFNNLSDELKKMVIHRSIQNIEKINA